MRFKFLALSLAVVLAGCSAPNTKDDGLLGLKRKPNLGYVWKNPDSYFSYEVSWNPGMRVSEYPHTTAAEQEGHWTADPGYGFSANGGPESASWQPGTRETNYPHVSASSVEGVWSADAGYALANKDDPKSAVWQPGSLDPNHAHIHAGTVEGQWTPDSGYQWASTTPGDMTVVAVQSPSSGPDGSEVGRVVVNTVAKSCAEPQQDDGFWATVGRVGCAVTALATEK